MYIHRICNKCALLRWWDCLLNVSCNDISVTYVIAHRCTGGLKKMFDLRSGSQRHRHFVGFFYVPTGVTSVIKVYTDVRLEGVCFSGLQVYEWVSFSHQKYINGLFFHPKSIWMGIISKIVYEWVQFSIWEVYEWVCFSTSPSLWMGWGPYPKPWQVTPPPPRNVPANAPKRGHPFYGYSEKPPHFSLLLRPASSHEGAIVMMSWKRFYSRPLFYVTVLLTIHVWKA